MKQQEQSKYSLYEVWRHDDNGNEFLVDSFHDLKSAEIRIAALEAGGHKQSYWLKEVNTGQVI